MANTSALLKERIDLPAFLPQPDDDVIICRCEEITKGEIRKAVHMGFWTVNEVKRYLRAGMGLCQGTTCGNHIKKVIAAEREIALSGLADMTPRPPMRALEAGVLGNEGRNE